MSHLCSHTAYPSDNRRYRRWWFCGWQGESIWLVEWVYKQKSQSLRRTEEWLWGKTQRNIRTVCLQTRVSSFQIWTSFVWNNITCATLVSRNFFNTFNCWSFVRSLSDQIEESVEGFLMASEQKYKLEQKVQKCDKILHLCQGRGIWLYVFFVCFFLLNTCTWILAGRISTHSHQDLILTLADRSLRSLRMLTSVTLYQRRLDGGTDRHRQISDQPITITTLRSRLMNGYYSKHIRYALKCLYVDFCDLLFHIYLWVIVLKFIQIL